MRWFVGQNIKGRRRKAFSQHYKSRSFGRIFGTLSEEINVKRIKCHFFQNYVEYVDKQKKTEEKFDSKFGDYCDIRETKKSLLNYLLTQN